MLYIIYTVNVYLTSSPHKQLNQCKIPTHSAGIAPVPQLFISFDVIHIPSLIIRLFISKRRSATIPKRCLRTGRDVMSTSRCGIRFQLPDARHAAASCRFTAAGCPEIPAAAVLRFRRSDRAATPPPHGRFRGAAKPWSAAGTASSRLRHNRCNR